MYSTVQYSPTSKRARQPGANFPPKDSGWRALSSPAHRLQHTMKPYHTILYHTTNVIPRHARVQHKPLSFTIQQKRIQHHTMPQASTAFHDTQKGFAAPLLNLQRDNLFSQTLIPIPSSYSCSSSSTEHFFANRRSEYILQVELSGLYPILIRYETSCQTSSHLPRLRRAL